MLQEAKVVGGLSIQLYTDFSAVEADWHTLEAHGHTTIFQSFEWCKKWMEAWGQALNVKPQFLVAKDRSENVAFILPWQIRRRFGFNLLEWLGQPSFTYGGGLFSSEFLDSNWFTQFGSELLKLAHGASVINLRNMPYFTSDQASPLKSWHNSKGANSSYELQLQPSFEALQSSRRTSKSLSKIRRRDTRLAELGDLVCENITDPDVARSAILECIDHKNRQLTENGVGDLFSKQDRQFYTEIFQANLVVFRLKLNDETLSTMIGANFANRFHLMIASLGAQLGQNLSPGDYLLRKTIAHFCRTNIQSYDFGSGEQAYKLLWTDVEVPLFNYIAAQSLKGAPFALVLSAFEGVKRFMKSNPRTRAFIFDWRERIFGRSS